MQTNLNKNIFDIIKIVAIAAIISFVIAKFMFRPVVVSGSSMEPTLCSGELKIVNEISNNYERNDIIIFNKNHTSIIKRIVGIPGDTVQIDNGLLYINGKQVINNFPMMKAYGNASSPILLKDKQYYVLGDNRNNSIDSRFTEVGIVYSDEILGIIL